MALEFESFTVTIRTTNTTFTKGMSGTVSMTFDGSQVATTMTASILFENNGLVYKTVNFTIDQSNSNNITFNGTFYHPTHGYVTVTTTTGFTKVGGDKYCGGTMHLVGKDGNYIDFTANSDCSSFDITVNEGGTITYQSGAVTWPSR